MFFFQVVVEVALELVDCLGTDYVGWEALGGYSSCLPLSARRSVYEDVYQFQETESPWDSVIPPMMTLMS